MKSEHGFTLIELMVTLSIAAILLTVGIPSMSDFIANNKITSQSNILVSFLQNARMEAVKTNRTTQVCVENNASTNSCDGSDWSTGLKLWSDKDNDNSVDANEVIRFYNESPGDITIIAAGFANSDYIEYQATGISDSTGTFDVCDAGRSGEAGARITINSTGRVSSQSIVCP